MKAWPGSWGRPRQSWRDARQVRDGSGLHGVARPFLTPGPRPAPRPPAWVSVLLSQSTGPVVAVGAGG